jgi:hypothetical protein
MTPAPLACILRPTPAQRTELDATLVAFAVACTHIAAVCRQLYSTNKVRVQRVCYPEVRERFGLSANLVIRAIARVCAGLKRNPKAFATFAPTSIDYDQRIFSYRPWDGTVSLMLLHGRQRLETGLGARQQQQLQGRPLPSATLVKRRNGTFVLYVPLTPQSPAAPASPPRQPLTLATWSVEVRTLHRRCSDTQQALLQLEPGLRHAVRGAPRAESAVRECVAVFQEQLAVAAQALAQVEELAAQLLELVPAVGDGLP